MYTYVYSKCIQKSKKDLGVLLCDVLPSPLRWSLPELKLFIAAGLAGQRSPGLCPPVLRLQTRTSQLLCGRWGFVRTQVPLLTQLAFLPFPFPQPSYIIFSPISNILVFVALRAEKGRARTKCLFFNHRGG